MALNGKPKPKAPTSGFDAYFQGYTVAQVKKKNGKYRTVRIYTAPYRVHDMTDAEWVRQKIAVGVLTAFAVACYLWAALERIPSNTVSYVALAGGLSAACLLFVTAYALSYLFNKRQMTIYECTNTSKALLRWTLLAGICLTITGAADLLYLILNRGQDLPAVLWSMARYLLSAGAVILLNRMEDKTFYTQEENETMLPFDRS